MIETAVPPLRDWPLSLKLTALFAAVLLPLGIIAASLSADDYRGIAAQRSLLAISQFDGYERVIVASLDADFTVLRTALLDAPGEIGNSRAIGCALLGRAAAFDEAILETTRVDPRGAPVCGTISIPADIRLRLRELGNAGGNRFKRSVVAEPGGAAFWLIIRDDGVRSSGDAVVARFSIAALRELLPRAAIGGKRVTLSDGPRAVVSWGAEIDCRQDRCTEIERPVGSTGLWLELLQRDPRLTVGQAAAIGLPILMWLAALGIGWWAAQALVARPLVQLQRAAERYSGGDRAARVGTASLRSREMAEFAVAFNRTADELDRRETELRAALAEQQRLTREVHHRIKNNLQIVSSLLSIEAREAALPSLAHAYATMQARVGALALVHRLVYDDAGARAIDLRALITELAASLEAQLAESEAIAVQLRLDLVPAIIGQDTAVPLAFALTELLGCAARASRPAPLDGRITLAVDGHHATVTVAAAGFTANLLTDAAVGPVQRIVNGMVRQLRGRLTHDAVTTSYRIDFPLPELTG